MRKVDPRSRLKTLPPERQEEIHAYLQTHSVAETETWARAQGIDVSSRMLQNFYHSYALTQRMESAVGLCEEVKEMARQYPSLGVDERQLSNLSLALFEAKALREEDAKLFTSLRRLRHGDETVAQRGEHLKLTKQRIQRETCRLFAEWYENEKAEEAMSNGTRAAQIDALGRAMFEDWDEE